MASGDMEPAGPPGQRHSGVVHGGLSRRPQPQRRRDWLLGGGVAGLTVIAFLVIANVLGGQPAAVAEVPTASPPSPSPASSLPIFVQETPAPTPTPSPTLAPTRPPTLAPTLPPSPTLAPTLPPTAPSTP